MFPPGLPCGFSPQCREAKRRHSAWFPALGMRSRIASHFRSDAIFMFRRSLPPCRPSTIPFPFIQPAALHHSSVCPHPASHKPCCFSNFQTLCHRAKTQVLCFQPNPNSFRKTPGIDWIRTKAPIIAGMLLVGGPKLSVGRSLRC